MTVIMISAARSIRIRARLSMMDLKLIILKLRLKMWMTKISAMSDSSDASAMMRIWGSDTPSLIDKRTIKNEIEKLLDSSSVVILTIVSKKIESDKKTIMATSGRSSVRSSGIRKLTLIAQMLMRELEIVRSAFTKLSFSFERSSLKDIKRLSPMP